MENDELFHKISKWANMLKKEEKIDHALRRLESVQINLRLLTETGVGKAVNSLRKHPNWGNRAFNLVARWKDVALAETAQIAADESDKQEKSTESGRSDECNNSTDEEDNNHRRKNNNKTSKLLETNKQKRPSKSPKNNCDEPIDAFSAQLTAADRIYTSKEKKRKKPRISAEIIQNSLLESLADPSLSQSVSQKSGQINQQKRINSNNSAADINMFKAPKENRRVYAGKRKSGENSPQVPKLFDICIRLLINNIDAIEETGDLTFDILKPVLERANSAQLYKLEEKNPHLQEDTEYLWKQHCEREFAKQLNEMIVKKRKKMMNNSSGSEDEDDEDEEECFEDDGLTWRERFAKFLHEREYKLRNLSKKINLKTTEMVEPQRKAMETAPIAPRHIRKKQIRNGVRINANSVPTAIELTRARRQIFETGNDADFRQMPSAIRNTKTTFDSSPFASFSKKKPQHGPLMMKTLKMLKMQKR